MSFCQNLMIVRYLEIALFIQSKYNNCMLTSKKYYTQNHLPITSSAMKNSSKEFGHSKNLSQIEQQSQLNTAKHQVNSSPPKNQTHNIHHYNDNAHNHNNQAGMMQVYEQNIKLKKQLESLENKITQLRVNVDKSNKQSNATKEIMEIIKLKKQNTELSQTVSALKYQKTGNSLKSKDEAKKVIHNYQKQKIQDLLKIIENHKKQIDSSETQIKNLQRENAMLRQQVSHKDLSRNEQLQNMQDEFKKEEKALVKLRETSRDLDFAKQQHIFLEAEISKLQSQLASKIILQDEIHHLRVENRKLEDNMRRLSESPLFQKFTEKIDEEGKFKTIETRCKYLEEKYQKQKQARVQLETELKMTQSQLVEASHEAQVLEKENLVLKSKVKTNPIVDMISQDQQILQKVVGFLQTQNYKSYLIDGTKSKVSTVGVDKKKMQTIIQQKEMLATELQRTQAMLQSLRETYEQRERIHMIQNKQKSMQVQLQNKKINDLEIQIGHRTKTQMLKDGIRYEDSVSMFSTDETTYTGGFNYFDVYLGNIILVETLVKLQTSISDVKKLLTFVTVDFYNHNTGNSKVGTGINYNINSQFSFKVSEDQFFFKYLEKGYLVLDLWASEGSKAINLGQCKIGLKPLIIKSKPGVAPVINSSIPIYLNAKAMGSINFVMRMRMPIYQQMKDFKSGGRLQQFQGLEKQVGKKRKLVIHISEGKGIKPTANSFVYYNLQMNDYYTNTHRGSNPIWDHWNIIQVNFNKDFQNYLRRNQLQFTLLDDNAPINDSEMSDVLGTAKISLNQLLQQKVINLTVTARKDSKIAAEMKLKIFWHQQQNMNLMSFGKKEVQRQVDFQKQITDQIKSYIKDNKLSPHDAFLLFDNNNTGLVSKQELEYGLLTIFSIKLTKQKLDAYYNILYQPLNESNFQKFFYDGQTKTKISIRPEIKKQSTNRSGQQPSIQPRISESIKSINELVRNNTKEIKKISLNSFLQGKDLLSLALQIDQNNDGMISKQQLETWLHAQGVQAELQQGEVNIIDFLKRHSQVQKQQMLESKIIKRTNTETSIKAPSQASYVPRKSRR